MQGVSAMLALAVGGGMFFGVNAVSDVILPPVGIEVHRLAFDQSDEPMMIQERTVTARSLLTAVFTATVSTSDASGLSEVCSGGSWWDYRPGLAAAKIPFDEWVADEGCYDRLPESVTLIACAEWRWGDGNSEKQCTLGFRKK